jgi:transcriptional regulator with XRE-family HTH domain
MAITAGQLRAARALLKLEQRGLADATNVPVQTLKRYEGGVGPLTGNYQNISSIVSYLENSGVVFLEHDETGGPGVRLRGGEDAGA